MRQSAQKQALKFCTSKRTKKTKTHPEKPEKGKTGCVLGAGRDENGLEWVRPGEKRLGERTDLSRLPARVLLPGGERPAPTDAAAETGAAAERHWRSLTPRHALRKAQPRLVAETFRSLTKKVRYRKCDT